MGRTWGEQVRQRERDRRRNAREQRIHERERAAARRAFAVQHPLRAAYRRFVLGR